MKFKFFMRSLNLVVFILRIILKYFMVFFIDIVEYVF